MATYDQLEHFFDEPARLEIEDDFHSECVLCYKHLNAGEGYFVPLVNTRRAVRNSSKYFGQYQL